ncbi:hypothetical protein EYD45_13565 [Hyunsoonleella flava]|uniref:Uncharacterized protein n=1 Tax=Hyunsoonleella flava TaxID=2527939 RepID=A0A4Q9FB49_9FLAO|nr:hypothetical protein [Hyunsoonleella flava]TBN00849.1 hypothetical protein EYD45_13565 [Hyunsoonleella flava]
MKYIILLIISCAVGVSLHAQEVNKEISIEGESPFLLGKIDKTGLTSSSYKSWFYKNYDDYSLDETTINAIGKALNEYSIKLFMGTWCGDSKREVPRFYKILEACSFPENQLSVIALGRKRGMYKKSPNHEEAGLNIHRVPTFIFYKDGIEVNRIVEHPVESLEKDILKIVTSNNYKSNYQIVSTVDDILKHDGLNGLKKRSKKLVKTFDGKVSNMFELNTYGNILYTINNKEEAIAVFKLNNMLFPDKPRTYMSLANVLGANKRKEEAITVLKRAVKLFPENRDLVENLQVIKSN